MGVSNISSSLSKDADMHSDTVGVSAQAQWNEKVYLYEWDEMFKRNS